MQALEGRMSKRETEEPRETRNGRTHPAFGVIRTVRTQGSTALFGSDFEHQHWVSVTICEACMERDYHRDRVAGEKIVVQFDMSEAQWAQMISSQGIHEGTPVTLSYKPAEPYKLERTPNIPLESSTDKFPDELKARIARVTEHLEALRKQISDDTTKLSGTQRRGMLSHVTMAIQEIGPNLEFVEESMTEHLHEKVIKAKTEVYAWMHAQVTAAGLEALGGKFPLALEGPKEIEVGDLGHPTEDDA
jgi:hypothetical protein